LHIADILFKNNKCRRKNMSRTLTTSEKILDQLAEGQSFSELTRRHGYSRQDFLTAALFGVAELQAEYVELLKKHGRFNHLTKTE